MNDPIKEASPKKEMVEHALYLERLISYFANNAVCPRKTFLSLDFTRQDLVKLFGFNKELDKVIDAVWKAWNSDSRVGTLDITEGNSAKGEGCLVFKFSFRLRPSNINIDLVLNQAEDCNCDDDYKCLKCRAKDIRDKNE